MGRYLGEQPTVWYWTGGRSQGEWRRTWGNTSELGLQETYHSIRLSGRVAKIGSVTIGPPEGPPRPEDFASVEQSGAR